MNLIDVSAANVESSGFFCYMSKRKSEGYRRKLDWLRERFSEGMRIRMAASPERGFIEYLPGEHAWRAVHAGGFLFVHCVWVVGKSKGKGLGIELLQACEEDARECGLNGVAMVTSERVWLAGRGLLEKRGFTCVEEAAPSFSLMVKTFRECEPPRFAGSWEEKARAFGDGVTVVRSDQCPYIVDATATVVAAAEKAGVPCRVVELRNRDDVVRLSPSPYGVFSIVRDGRLLSYHYLLEKDLLPLLG